MKQRYSQFNPKRRIDQPKAGELARLRALAERAVYGGNPEHKKNPGDFGLTPPAEPRQGKSLCDVAQVFSRAVACSLLREGLRRGLVSDRLDRGWPTIVWAVTQAGAPVEARLENAETGSYHGYPMPDTDPLATEVRRRWGRACG